MINSAPAASARPDIISLDVLLNDVDEGRVQIPRFQRPYVWTPQMMRELFESVISGYPIGSLLFWTPRELTVKTMDHIGPLPVPTSAPNAGVSLVLDGHQRLATLYGVLRLPDSFAKDEHIGADKLSWWIGYDLRTQETRQMRHPDDFNSPTLLPLRAILKTADFVRFARSIDSAVDLTQEDKVIFLDRADAVQRSIRDYRIALTSMRDGTVNDAVAIFSRINRSGRRMSTDQMAVALTYREGFNLEEALDRILGRLGPFGFGDVSRTIIVQTLLQGAGQSFTKPRFDDLRKPGVQKQLQDAEEPVAEALCNAAKFLNGRIMFKTGRLLPYALQLLLLAIFFRVRKMDYDALASEWNAVLSRWFWATSFSGWFASANTSEMTRAAETMMQFASGTSIADARKAFEFFFIDRQLRPFPKTFDRRSARIRAMLLVQMARAQMIDPVSGEYIDGSAIFADRDRADIPYVFPPDGTQSARSPANRILLDRKYGSSARSALSDHLENISALETHGIGEAARAAILVRNLADFVQAREKDIKLQENLFLKQFDLSIADSVEQSEEEVDIEED